MPVSGCVSLLIVFLMRNTFPSREEELAETILTEADPISAIQSCNEISPPSVVIVDVDASGRSPGLPRLSVFSLSWPSGTLAKWFDPKPGPLITAGQSMLHTDLQAESRWYSGACGKAAGKRKDRPELRLKQREPNILFSTLAVMVLLSRIHKHGSISVFLAHI